MQKISIVIPLHNEKDNIDLLYQKLDSTLSKLKNSTHEIIFIDDGSTDNTAHSLLELRKKDPRVKIIELSRNFGHQIALTSGLHHATGDIIIMMDGDLQHPPELIPELIQAHEKGYEIVYTKKQNSKNLPFIKQLTSHLFYKIFNLLSDTKIIPDSSDYRLITKKVLQSFQQINEKKLFLRGIFPAMGFSHTEITFQPSSRHSGKSSYTFKKMLNLCISGTTSFSGKLLRIPLYIGIFTTIIATIYSTFILINFFQGNTVPGWTSGIIITLFFGSIQLIFLGILGEYLYVMFTEVKNRPLYFVKAKHGFPEKPE